MKFKNVSQAKRSRQILGEQITPLPRSVWTQTAHIKDTVFETIATLSPTDWNFIFTNELINDSTDKQLY